MLLAPSCTTQGIPSYSIDDLTNDILELGVHLLAAFDQDLLSSFLASLQGVPAYSIENLTNDIVALIEHLLAASGGQRTLALGAHDWGGAVAWHVRPRVPGVDAMRASCRGSCVSASLALPGPQTRVPGFPPDQLLH